MDLGVVEYRDAVRLQHALREARQLGEIPDSVLILEHPPVYTLGRRTDPRELPMGDRWYEDRSIAIERTNRGGRATYHGPGQLVAYPILSLDPWCGDVVCYIRLLERTIIAALGDVGVRSVPGKKGLTGVWVADRKIASIGIHVSRGVTMHGIAINLVNDLTPFEWIVPCGIEGCKVTSVAREVGQARSVSMAVFKPIVGRRLAEILDHNLVEVDAESLIRTAQPSTGSEKPPGETPKSSDEKMAAGNTGVTLKGGNGKPPREGVIRSHKADHIETSEGSGKSAPKTVKRTAAV